MKKITAIILSALMVLCYMPSMAFADVAPTEPPTSEVAEKVDLSKAEVKVTGSYVYTGSPIEPTITVNGKDLDKTCVDLTYGTTENSDHTSAGEVSLTITAKDTNEKYTGSATVKFTIAKATLDSCTLEPIPVLPIGGTLTAGQIKLKLNDIELNKDSRQDYTVGTISPTVAKGNSVTLTAVENGNFTGTRVVSYYGATIIDSTEDTNNYKISMPEEAKRPKIEYTGNKISATTSLYKLQVKNSEGKWEDVSTTFYDVSFENNTNAGFATVVIKGINGYSGTLTAEKAFEITRKDINKCSFSNYEYQVDGVADDKIVVTVKDGTKVLGSSEYGTRKDANGKIIVFGVNNYQGEKPLNVSYGKTIENATVTFYPSSFTYTGSPCKPTFTVKTYVDTELKTLKEGTDYKVEYTNNINIGTATAKIIGIGKFAGSQEKTFNITQKDLGDTDVSATIPSDSYLFDGKEVRPAVTVRAGGRTLVLGTDYKVSYYSNDKIGTATLSVLGIGNYTGSIWKTFKIAGKDISVVSATLSQTAYNYDGLEKKPTVTVYDGTKKLTIGTDYTVEYKDNKNCGTASVIITGKGNYSGTKTLYFDIVGKTQTVKTSYTYYTKYLTSKSFNLNASSDGDGTLTFTSSDPSVATVDAKGQVTIKGTGKAVIKVETKNNVAYSPAYKDVHVKVLPKKPVFKVTSAVKDNFRVQITKVDGATKYQVRYGREGKYTNKYVTHYDNQYTKTVTTLNSSKLTSGKYYYIKVRSYKKLASGEIVWGNWTTVKKVKCL